MTPVFKVPNLSAVDFAALLETLRICSPGRAWALGKSLEQALRECPRSTWIEAVVYRADGRWGFPTWGEYYAAVDSRRGDYMTAQGLDWDALNAVVKSLFDIIPSMKG